MENGPQREDGYALLTGDAVGLFIPCTSESCVADNCMVTGHRSLPTTFGWQPISNAFPFFSDYHRRAAAGLAAHHLTRFDTCQIREMPRGKLTCGRRGGGHVLEDCRGAWVWAGSLEDIECGLGMREADAWGSDLCTFGTGKDCLVKRFTE